MNFRMYFLVTISLPLLISCSFNLVSSLQVEKTIEKMGENKTVQKLDGNFEKEIEICYLWVQENSKAYYDQCINELLLKIRTKDPYCCKRVVLYKCLKRCLTSKSGVSNKEVEKNDVNFNYWNAKIKSLPRKCSGTKKRITK